MGRNSAGLYTLPEPAFINGTTILSAKVNSDFSDLETEMTDSLSRSGKGPMLAQLKLTDGTAAAPTPSYANALDMGWWRNGANDYRVTAGSAVNAMRINLTEVRSYLNLVAEKGATVTNSTTNGAGVTSTGDGTGAGLVATGGATGRGATLTGGSTSGVGVVATGTGNSAGATLQGHGTAAGATITGGATGRGITASGGSTSGDGILATGVGTGSYGVNAVGGTGTAGGTFASGTAATATVAQDAIQLSNGYLGMSGVTSPNADVALTNTITPSNIIKAWALITTGDSSGVGTVVDGFNVSSVTVSNITQSATITFATAMASANYGTKGTVDAIATAAYVLSPQARTTTTLEVYVASATTGNNRSLYSQATTFYVEVTGKQA